MRLRLPSPNEFLENIKFSSIILLFRDLGAIKEGLEAEWELVNSFFDIFKTLISHVLSVSLLVYR